MTGIAKKLYFLSEDEVLDRTEQGKGRLRADNLRLQHQPEKGAFG